MTFALIGLLSIAVLVLGVLLGRRLRDERQRSEARIVALASAMDDARWDMPLESGVASDVSPSANLVSLVAPPPTTTSRLPAFAAAAVVVLCIVGLLGTAMNGGKRTPRHAEVAAPATIELVTMRHVLDGETLVVSGLVRNPSSNETPSLSAIVSVVGNDGHVVARGESPLDAGVLGPGKETTFRVSVPDVSDPGRYRVAFMNGGQVVPHVDRRSDVTRTALASDARGN
jgi:hypothetical protein